MKKLLVLALVLGIASNCFAYSAYWARPGGAGADQYFNNKDNWIVNTTGVWAAPSATLANMPGSYYTYIGAADLTDPTVPVIISKEPQVYRIAALTGCKVNRTDYYSSTTTILSGTMSTSGLWSNQGGTGLHNTINSLGGCSYNLNAREMCVGVANGASWVTWNFYNGHVSNSKELRMYQPRNMSGSGWAEDPLVQLSIIGGLIEVPQVVWYDTTGRQKQIIKVINGTLKVDDSDGSVKAALEQRATDGYITTGVGMTLDISWDGDYAYVQAIPEPATIALLGFGALALIRRKK